MTAFLCWVLFWPCVVKVSVVLSWSKTIATCHREVGISPFGSKMRKTFMLRLCWWGSRCAFQAKSWCIARYPTCPSKSIIIKILHRWITEVDTALKVYIRCLQCEQYLNQLITRFVYMLGSSERVANIPFYSMNEMKHSLSQHDSTILTTFVPRIGNEDWLTSDPTWCAIAGQHVACFSGAYWSYSYSDVSCIIPHPWWTKSTLHLLWGRTSPE